MPEYISALKPEFEHLLAENAISILRKSSEVNAGHIGGSLSLSSFLLPMLYLWSRDDNPKDIELVLSKGHASLGLYSVLKTLGRNPSPFNNYCTLDNKSFHGHTCKHADSLIVHSTGSLGHGLPFSYGRALGNYIQGYYEKRIVVCILGDGEFQEGTLYESYLHYSQNPHLELKIIIDDNSSIATHTANCAQILERFAGDDSYIIDCLDSRQCLSLYDIIKSPGLRVVHCKTCKYVGLPEPYHDPKWHAGIPTPRELDAMISGLGPFFAT